MFIRFHTKLFAGGLLLSSLILGCGDKSRPDIGYDPQNDTISAVSTPDTLAPTTQDTTVVAQAPIPTPIPPDRLAEFLPAMSDWSAGELQQETRIRPNFKSSKVLQTYVLGEKKVSIEINDYCNVPFLYEPFSKYMEGDYLNDDNLERTETTTIRGFKAVQSIEKKSARGNMFLFPGGRYVIAIVGEGISGIDELRSIATAIDLPKLATLQ